MSEYLEIKWAKIKLNKPIIGKEFYVRGDGDHQFGASSKLHYDTEGNTYLHVCFCPKMPGAFTATLYFHDRIYRNGKPFISKRARYKAILTATKEAESAEWMYFYGLDYDSSEWSLYRFNTETIERIGIDDVTFRIDGISQERIDKINIALSYTSVSVNTPISDVGSVLDNGLLKFNNNALYSTLSIYYDAGAD